MRKTGIPIRGHNDLIKYGRQSISPHCHSLFFLSQEGKRWLSYTPCLKNSAKPKWKGDVQKSFPEQREGEGRRATSGLAEHGRLEAEGVQPEARGNASLPVVLEEASLLAQTHAALEALEAGLDVGAPLRDPALPPALQASLAVSVGLGKVVFRGRGRVRVVTPGQGIDQRLGRERGGPALGGGRTRGARTL